MSTVPLAEAMVWASGEVMRRFLGDEPRLAQEQFWIPPLPNQIVSVEYIAQGNNPLDLQRSEVEIQSDNGGFAAASIIARDKRGEIKTTVVRDQITDNLYVDRTSITSSGDYDDSNETSREVKTQGVGIWQVRELGFETVSDRRFMVHRQETPSGNTITTATVFDRFDIERGEAPEGSHVYARAVRDEDGKLILLNSEEAQEPFSIRTHHYDTAGRLIEIELPAAVAIESDDDKRYLVVRFYHPPQGLGDVGVIYLDERGMQARQSVRMYNPDGSVKSTNSEWLKDGVIYKKDTSFTY